MKNKNVLWVVGALIVGALLGYLIAQPGKDSADMSDMHHAESMEAMMDDMNATIASKDGEAFEAAFLEEMIVHHEGAVRMAETVLEKSKRPELVQMAEGIIKVQNLEIDIMKQWHQEWFGK